MQQPQYDPQQQYGPQAPAPRPARNGLGTAALVLGIIGTVSGFIPFLFWLAGILGLIALILGLSGRGRVKRGEAANKGVTTIGAVLGLVALILSVVGAVLTFKAVDEAVDEINKATKGSTATKEPAGTKDKGGDSSGKDDKNKGLAAGDSAAYDDKLKVTVSAPKAYTPDEYAAGHTKGNKAYQVTVVVQNDGKEKFDATLLSADARAGEDGVPAEQIFDGKVGSGFTGTILPGKKSTVQLAFDAPADARTLTVEVSPGFAYDASVWELKL
ncbi:DUF4352 domain-containing protein [Streptomyces sp. NBC_01142]|uniref:DUF4352 domain-containing protein n=1 Tax=Streptomyces sp. NBC_01142 TaxID=2975865 RepID=UPI0022551883|nr:DUF4352 domain-containing protein [Streptomyces sp. NBC_01142]MCX4823640.1 DUF4352 domain-containing protein [Streptomyces sp. NBC_01142]